MVAIQLVVHEAFDMTWCEVGIVAVLVDAEHDGRVLPGSGRGDDDLLGATRLVSRCGRGVGEEARRLDDDIDAVVSPRKLGRVAFRHDLDLVAINGNGVVRRRLDGAGVDAVARVVPEHVGVRRRVGQIVDRNDLQRVRVSLLDGSKHLSTDPSKAVDSYLEWSSVSPPNAIEFGEDLSSVSCQRIGH